VCASAQIPARALARELAGIAAMVGDSTTTVHVSGCAKGCACPRPAPLTVVGIDGGCGVVVGGSARGVPLAMLAPDDVPGALAHLMDTVRRLRAPGESTAAALSRLDRAQIARALSQEAHVA
jgi:precorrin-3B synthase